MYFTFDSSTIKVKCAEMAKKTPKYVNFHRTMGVETPTAVSGIFSKISPFHIKETLVGISILHLTITVPASTMTTCM